MFDDLELFPPRLNIPLLLDLLEFPRLNILLLLFGCRTAGSTFVIASGMIEELEFPLLLRLPPLIKFIIITPPTITLASIMNPE